MKVRLFIFLILVTCLCACTGTDYRSRKQVAQGIDYSRYPGNEAYYEFTSELPSSPSILDEVKGSGPADQTEEVLGEDEDFTSEALASTYGNYGDVVVTVASRKFKLGPNASRKEMAVFQQSLDKAYSKSLRTYQPSGFTYSISSVGAVNPLSDIEVNCKLSERSANDVGQATCSMFFGTIRTAYLDLIKEAK